MCDFQLHQLKLVVNKSIYKGLNQYINHQLQLVEHELFLSNNGFNRFFF
jgi:hypothetical protein